MREKKPLNRAVKNDHFDLLVSFQSCDDFVELRNCVRAKNVEGRVINRYAPIRSRLSGQKNLFVAHIYRYSALCLAQRLERRAKLGHEDFRTRGFTRREAGQVELFSETPNGLGADGNSLNFRVKVKLQSRRSAAVLLP